MTDQETQLRKDIETLEARYNASTTRNAYRIGERLRAKKAELERITNNVRTIDTGYVRKEITIGAGMKKVLTNMATEQGMSLKPFIEYQLERMVKYGKDYIALWNECEDLRTKLEQLSK